MKSQKTFSEAKADFDAAHHTASTAKCLVPVNGKHRVSAPIRDAYGKPSEEYYKWQFIHGLINSGLYASDYIGVEVQFPRFPDSVRQSIASLYHHPGKPPAAKQSLANFVAWHREWNEKLGIWELDRELKALQRTLTKVQDQIIEGRTIHLPF